MPASRRHRVPAENGLLYPLGGPAPDPCGLVPEHEKYVLHKDLVVIAPGSFTGMVVGSRGGVHGREMVKRTDVQFRNLPAREPELAILGSMGISFTDCYEAVRTRNPAFDGCFFTGVTSTEIFCRPVCPAVTPRPENCL